MKKTMLRKVSSYGGYILFYDKGYGFRVEIRGEQLSEPLTAEDVARDFPFLEIPDGLLEELEENEQSRPDE